MPLTIEGTHTRHQVVASNASVLSINDSNLALHGRLYFANDNLNIYIGNHDGTLSLINGDPFIGAIDDTNSIDLINTSGTLTAGLIVDPDLNNNLSVSSTGVFVPKLTVKSGSTGYINIDGNYEISVSNLSIIDVTVDNVETSMAAWIAEYYTGTEFQEGDAVILTAIDPRETWLHNGGSAGTIADFTQISDGISDAAIRSLFSAVTPLVYNSTTGAFSLAGLTTFGTSGQVITSTGTGYAYSNLDDLVVAYKTVQNTSTSLAQQDVLSFLGNGLIAANDGAGNRTTVALQTRLEQIGSLSAAGADRILFHDQSANGIAWLTVGTGLSLSGTTLSATATSDTNAWVTINTASTKPNAKTGDIYREDSISIGIGQGGGYTPLGMLNVQGDIAILDNDFGLILTDSDGERWKVNVLTDGSLITTAVI